MSAVSDALLVLKLRRHGIVIPRIALGVARRERFPLAVLAAVLSQESNGGHNVFGHDPTIFIGAGKVTELKYRAYRWRRGPTGKGGMQGVGPMQLTWFAYQDNADKIGGCWNPTANVTIGVRVLKANGIRSANVPDLDVWYALKAYNGSSAYANEVMKRIADWRAILR